MDGTVEEVREEENESKVSSNSNEESIIVDFQFTISDLSNYDDNSILIDMGSTFSVIKNPKMVINASRTSQR